MRAPGPRPFRQWPPPRPTTDPPEVKYQAAVLARPSICKLPGTGRKPRNRTMTDVIGPSDIPHRLAFVAPFESLADLVGTSAWHKATACPLGFTEEGTGRGDPLRRLRCQPIRRSRRTENRITRPSGFQSRDFSSQLTGHRRANEKIAKSCFTRGKRPGALPALSRK